MPSPPISPMSAAPESLEEMPEERIDCAFCCLRIYALWRHHGSNLEPCYGGLDTFATPSVRSALSPSLGEGEESWNAAIQSQKDGHPNNQPDWKRTLKAANIVGKRAYAEIGRLKAEAHETFANGKLEGRKEALEAVDAIRYEYQTYPNARKAILALPEVAK